MKPQPNSGASAPRGRSLSGRARRLSLLGVAMLGTMLVGSVAAHANTTPFDLSTGNFTQDWTNTGLITANDDWSAVPSITGYNGSGLSPTTTRDPRTALADTGFTQQVFANRTDTTTTVVSGGNYEFEIADPVVAFQGSGSASSPFLLITLNSTNRANLNVSYLLRDVDPQSTKAIQPVALQYRVGTTGTFTNVDGAYVSDAAGAAGTATLTTQVNVALPAAVANQPVVQLRIITTDATGSDELIGVDNINVTSTATGGTAQPTNPTGSGAASPSSIAQGQSTLLTVAVTPGANPASTGITVTGDLTPIGGNATQRFFDDGTNGDATAGDNTFSYLATVASTTTPGAKSLTTSIADSQNRTASATISLTVTQATSPSTTIVISEFRSRGTAGSGDEFVELYNLSNSTISIGGYTLQYSSSGGSGPSTLSTVPANVTLPAGQHYLFSATGSSTESQANATFSAGIADTGGVGIVDAAGNLVDAVGLSPGTKLREGTDLGTFPSNGTDQSFERLPLNVNNQDTQNNAADFQLVTSNPQPFTTNRAPVVPNANITASVNSAFSFQLLGRDEDNDPITFAVAPGFTLPPGVSLSASGVLSGTPTQVGQFLFSLDVSDNRGGTTRARYIFNVNNATDGIGPVITRSALPSPATRDRYASLTLTGTVRDVAPDGVTPTGVMRMFVQVRRISDGFAYNGQAFTSNTSQGYYPVTISASTGDPAETRNWSRPLSFLPSASVLTSGDYGFSILSQDNAGNYSLQVVNITVVTPPANSSALLVLKTPRKTPAAATATATAPKTALPKATATQDTLSGGLS